MIDRSEVRDRSLTWQQVTDAYGAALRDLRPDVDLEALFACEDAAIAWEAVRQATTGHGMEPFWGVPVYRDHRTIGGWFMALASTRSQIFADLFADFEMRAKRLLAAHGVPLPDAGWSLADLGRASGLIQCRRPARVARPAASDHMGADEASATGGPISARRAPRTQRGRFHEMTRGSSRGQGRPV
jgi:hypothetical protein